jgi:hypothetical protein
MIGITGKMPIKPNKNGIYKEIQILMGNEFSYGTAIEIYKARG